jgi:hypothetical protein
MPKCHECGREFSTEPGLAQHLKDKHETGAVQSVNRETVLPKIKTEKRSKTLRKRNTHRLAIGVGVLAVAIVVGGYLVAGPYLAGPPFPYISGESYIHVHPYLQIWIEGKNVTIPCGVGALNGVCGGSPLEPIHTHDASGVLHIELGQADAGSHNFTLGDFFTIWKWSSGDVQFNGTSHPIMFTSTDILGYTADATHHVYLLVDGKNSTAWGSLNLEELDYCNSSIGTNSPCQTANGNPYWRGGTSYPFGTGHKIVIEYATG